MERHWEQGSDNEADVRPVGGAGAQEHRRETQVSRR